MKRLLSVVLAAGLLLVPLAYNTQAMPDTRTPPPVAQPLVREGDFAASLAETLGLGTASSEAEAENMMTSAGIAPKNGWLADYPVTPDIVGELQDAVASAADSGQVKMTRAEAVKAFQTLTTDYGLPVVREAPVVLGDQAQYNENPAPEGSDQYQAPTVIEDYYYEEGPPVVSYYQPPWDYNYMYSWVPYPFWWGGFAFSGFFVLSDFHCFNNFHHGNFHHGNFHRFHNGRGLVSNHVVNHNTNRVSVINPARRASGSNAMVAANRTGQRGFTSQADKTGAASIMGRSQQRPIASNRSSATSGTNRSAVNTSGAGSGGASRERTGAVRGSGSSDFAGRGGQRAANLNGGQRMGSSSSGVQRRDMNRGVVNGTRTFDGRGRMGVDRSFAGNNRTFRAPQRGGGDSFRSSRGNMGGGSVGRGGFSRGGGYSMGGGGVSRGGNYAMGGGGSHGGGGFHGGGGGGGHGGGGGGGGHGR
jgi:hypothetical protein